MGYRRSPEPFNSYIAYSDVLVVVLVIVVLCAVGGVDDGDVAYRVVQNEFEMAVKARKIPMKTLPRNYKNDPPGAQRWVLDWNSFFRLDASGSRLELSRGGIYQLRRFRSVLEDHGNLWRRVTVEGHAQPSAIGEIEQWDTSARNSALVFAQLASARLSIAGRPPAPAPWLFAGTYKGRQDPCAYVSWYQGDPSTRGSLDAEVESIVRQLRQRGVRVKEIRAGRSRNEFDRLKASPVDRLPALCSMVPNFDKPVQPVETVLPLPLGGAVISRVVLQRRLNSRVEIVVAFARRAADAVRDNVSSN